MKKRNARSSCTRRAAFGITFTLLLAVLAHSQEAQPKAKEVPAEWKGVESAMGRSGELQSDGTFKFSMPRKDLKVTVAGTQVKAGFALGSWTAFNKTGNAAMVTGDLVLTENEVGPVMQKLMEGGVEITALHNHLLHETPRVMYMHIGGTGNPEKLAQTIKAALSLTGTPSGEAGGGQETPQLVIDESKIEQTLGQKGKVKGGVLQFSVPRAKTTMFQPAGAGSPREMSISNSMGVAQAINFQPTGDGKAAITGDFVLIAKEVNPVIRALRDSGIEVTALHSHMLEDQPHLFFMHFWANDDAVKLAAGLKTALDKIDVKKGQ